MFVRKKFVGLNLIDLEEQTRLGNTLVIAEAIAASTVRQANNGSLVSRPAISLAEMLFGFLQENFQFFFRHLPMISKAIQMSPDLASTQHLYLVARLVEKKGGFSRGLPSTTNVRQLHVVSFQTCSPEHNHGFFRWTKAWPSSGRRWLAG